MHVYQLYPFARGDSSVHLCFEHKSFYPNTSFTRSPSQHDLLLVFHRLSSATNNRCSQAQAPADSPNSSILAAFRSRIDDLLAEPFRRISFAEGRAYLDSRTAECERATDVRDFTKEEERRLVDELGQGRPLLVTHFPCELKPFYCSSADGHRSDSVDLLFPGVGEIVGGSLREMDETVLRQRCVRNASTLEWYFNMRRMGCVPHGGFGLGFDRLLQFLFGVANIREVIPFPRSIDRIVL